jgi:benzoylformate decarboxylase
MPDNAVIVEEAPSHRNAMHDHLPIRRTGGFYAGASGGLGWALPAAVGVSLAEQSRRVICVLGDGSSLYSIQGLWTAADHRLPITFVILNKGVLRSRRSGWRWNRDAARGQPSRHDFVNLAIGFGCSSERAEVAERFEPALRESFDTEGPTSDGRRGQ